MDKDELSLENLAMMPCFSDPKAMAEIKPPKPGGLTDEEIAAMIPDYDVGMKIINGYIYRTNLYSGLGIGIMKMRRRQYERMKHLFGLSDDNACVKWLETHNAGDHEVVDALVSDAMATGKWKELPDELQAMYHARKQAQV